MKCDIIGQMSNKNNVIKIKSQQTVTTDNIQINQKFQLAALICWFLFQNFVYQIQSTQLRKFIARDINRMQFWHVCIQKISNPELPSTSRSKPLILSTFLFVSRVLIQFVTRGSKYA